MNTPRTHRTKPKRLMSLLSITHGLAGRWLALLALALFAPAGRAADNQPPGKMTFQGFLTDKNGAPLGNPTANYTVIFRLYKSATSTASADRLWSEQQIVTVDKGHFSVLLGQGSAFGAESFSPDVAQYFSGGDASDRFLSIKLATDADEILPRIQFFPAPYAHLARKANALARPDGTSVLTADAFRITSTTDVTAPSFTGSGANLTGLSAAQVTGTLDVDRIPSLDAGKITTGLLPDARIASLSASKITGTLDPARIPSLDASKVTTGLIADYLLSANVVKKGADNRVGINTSSPRCPLEVRGITPVFIPDRGRVEDLEIASADRSGTGPANTTGAGPAKMSSYDFSIMVEWAIGAKAYYIESDARIKDVVARPSLNSALAEIQRLRVTDFRLVDQSARDGAVKRGFIAQEIEKVMPEAVNKGRGVVPDIYSFPSDTEFDSGARTLTLTMKAAHGLAVGDVVQLNHPGGQDEYTVTAVPSSTRFTVNSPAQPAKVFVYGRRVDDFRTVDYDRIFTTGIGAMQELARRSEADAARITELERKAAELEQKASRVASLERDLADLRQLVVRMAGGAADNGTAGALARVSRGPANP